MPSGAGKTGLRMLQTSWTDDSPFCFQGQFFMEAVFGMETQLLCKAWLSSARTLQPSSSLNPGASLSLSGAASTWVRMRTYLEKLGSTCVWGKGRPGKRMLSHLLRSQHAALRLLAEQGLALLLGLQQNHRHKDRRQKPSPTRTISGPSPDPCSSCCWRSMEKVLSCLQDGPKGGGAASHPAALLSCEHCSKEEGCLPRLWLCCTP